MVSTYYGVARQISARMSGWVARWPWVAMVAALLSGQPWVAMSSGAVEWVAVGDHGSGAIMAGGAVGGCPVCSLAAAADHFITR